MDLTILHLINRNVLFASAGGGGSGGSGNGGGIFYVLGYIPMHLLGAFIRKSKKEKWLFDGLEVVGWLVSVAYMVLWVFVLHGLGLVIGLLGFLGMGAGLYGWFGKLKQSKRVKQELVQASQQDPMWNEQYIINQAKSIFMAYQQDWSSYNTGNMKKYMSASYFNHASLMISALQQADRKDLVKAPVISSAVVLDLTDTPDNSKDLVIVGFTASADDQLIDTRSNQSLFEDKKPFTEYWRFVRSNNSWLLDGIQPATANQWTYNASLEQFAMSNGFYFSLDWGWLLLPNHGQLFGPAKFGKSDINNHVIGMYNNCLIQLYTYIPAPRQGGYGAGANFNSYLIAQASLPKSYGDIVLRRKNRLHPFGIHGLQQVSLEWPDFNQKFEVYASDIEQVTSFELLNPSFMEKLYDQPFEINLEVVDNVVYFYAPEADKINIPQADRYTAILQILYQAFKEMRL